MNRVKRTAGVLVSIMLVFMMTAGVIPVMAQDYVLKFGSETHVRKAFGLDVLAGGNIVAIGGFEKGATVTGGTAKQAGSYTKGAWYALYNGSDTAFAFKVPSNSSMGDKLVVYTTGTPSLKSGVSGSGTSFWSGNGYSSATGGSTVSLSDYNSNSGSGPGGGPGGGGGWGH